MSELFVLELPRLLCAECTGQLVMDAKCYERDKASGHERIARLIVFCVNPSCKMEGERVELDIGTLKRTVKPYGAHRDKSRTGTTEGTDPGPPANSGGD
jgi:hypothetical protein